MKDLVLIFPSYVAWHYRRALSEYIAITNNVLWFTANFFSIGLLCRTFFAPWKRLDVPKTSKETLGMKFERYVVGTLMRFVGMGMRSIMIAFGSFMWIGAFGVFFLGFFLWLAMPLVVIGLFYAGGKLIIS